MLVVHVDGEEVASAAEVVKGFWKRLLMSNFLMDEASDEAGVVDVVELVAVIGICTEPDAEVTINAHTSSSSQNTCSKRHRGRTRQRNPTGHGGPAC